ncbi:syntaxin-2-like [Solea solea]|uniref:syntaxin-2-like n=1 Tax=Solea solea TaxID=90069 RepID=UPI00272C8ED3|nr:syntaxin-2-like [Solea solea]XP_058472813.1 syntaxin-2-like [Solea solea]XP_058472814.1 syntaxin-2-like [Solea solea]
MTNLAEKRRNMEDFFTTVAEVKSLIEKISSQAEEVERSHSVVLSAPNHDRRNTEKLEQLNSEIKRSADLVRAKLKSMQKNLSAEKNGKSFSVIQRIETNQHSHLTRWFAETMRGYHNAQLSFRDKCKAQIQRQLEIVGKVTTDEELEVMLHRDSLTIFISNISCDVQISSQALSEIESRHQDIVCLEWSIKELHEIFIDTAMLLESQGDLINNIEKNVSSAVDYVDMSKEETNKAVTYKKNPYKIASLPSFLKPFKRQTSFKTAMDQNPSNSNHN